MQLMIAVLRKEKRITQEELAVKTGISRTIISGLESGRIDCTTTKTLEKIAAALEVSVKELIGEG